jgi:P27 family predicted phage terminase small subunit
LQDKGREVWRRLWEAGKAWLSPQTDIDIITRLCETLDLRESIWEQLAGDGLMTIGSMRQARAHPLLDTLRNIDRLITHYERLCGFTPADRARLGLIEVQRSDLLEGFLAKRRARKYRSERGRCAR